MLFRENQVLRLKYESIRHKYEIERSLSPPTRMSPEKIRLIPEEAPYKSEKERRNLPLFLKNVSENRRKRGFNAEEKSIDIAEEKIKEEFKWRREQEIMEQKIFELREENGRLLIMNDKLIEEIEKYKELIDKLEKRLASQENTQLNNKKALSNFSLISEFVEQFQENSMENIKKNINEKIHAKNRQLQNLKNYLLLLKPRVEESKHQYGVLLRELERKNQKLKESRKEIVYLPKYNELFFLFLNMPFYI
jgi:hypothetical protein